MSNTRSNAENSKKGKYVYDRETHLNLIETYNQQIANEPRAQIGRASTEALLLHYRCRTLEQVRSKIMMDTVYWMMSKLCKDKDTREIAFPFNEFFNRALELECNFSAEEEAKQEEHRMEVVYSKMRVV